MRRRHWDELVATTGKEINLPYIVKEGSSSKFGKDTALNEDLLVGDILQLDLHKGLSPHRFTLGSPDPTKDSPGHTDL